MNFSFCLQYELKMTSTSSKDTFGIAFHYKTNYSTFSQETLLNSEILNIPLFPKNLFLAKIRIVQTILVYFFQYELLFWAHILTQKWLQLHQKMPLRPPFTTKLITLLLVNKRCLILNFWIFHFSKRSIFGQNLHSTHHFSVFSSMNFSFWLQYWLKNDFIFIGRCLWSTFHYKTNYSTFS